MKGRKNVHEKSQKEKRLRAFVEHYSGEEIPEGASSERLERCAAALLSLLGDDGRKEAQKEFRLTRREMNLSYD